MNSWYILGAGAMGCLWGANLSRLNHQVTLLLKNEQALSHFNKNKCISLHQGDTVEKIPVSANLVTSVEQPIDNLLITTKSHQTMEALASISSSLSSHTNILLLQNGMGVAEKINETYPDTSLFCAVTTEGAYCPEPYTVVHAGKGSTLVGGFNKSTDPTGLVNQLSGGFLEIETCADIQSAQWQKLVVNCAINGLTALFKCRNGELLTIPEASARLRRVCDEIGAIELALKIANQGTSVFDKAVSVIQLTAENYSSMYQDIHNRRLTEIDAINGYLISKAEEAGLPCPENQMLVRDIYALEAQMDCS